jgi:hypothetical protein
VPLIVTIEQKQKVSEQSGRGHFSRAAAGIRRAFRSLRRVTAGVFAQPIRWFDAKGKRPGRSANQGNFKAHNQGDFAGPMTASWSFNEPSAAQDVRPLWNRPATSSSRSSALTCCGGHSDRTRTTTANRDSAGVCHGSRAVSAHDLHYELRRCARSGRRGTGLGGHFRARHGRDSGGLPSAGGASPNSADAAHLAE